MFHVNATLPKYFTVPWHFAFISLLCNLRRLNSMVFFLYCRILHCKLFLLVGGGSIKFLIKKGHWNTMHQLRDLQLKAGTTDGQTNPASMELILWLVLSEWNSKEENCRITRYFSANEDLHKEHQQKWRHWHIYATGIFVQHTLQTETKATI